MLLERRVHKEMLDPRAQLVRKVLQALTERRARRALRAQLGPKVLLVLKVLRGKLENRAYRGLLARKAPRVFPALPERRVLKVLLGKGLHSVERIAAERSITLTT